MTFFLLFNVVSITPHTHTHTYHICESSKYNDNLTSIKMSPPNITANNVIIVGSKTTLHYFGDYSYKVCIHYSCLISFVIDCRLGRGEFMYDLVVENLMKIEGH